jgi:hypothetical protein
VVTAVGLLLTIGVNIVIDVLVGTIMAVANSIMVAEGVVGAAPCAAVAVEGVVVGCSSNGMTATGVATNVMEVTVGASAGVGGIGAVIGKTGSGSWSGITLVAETAGPVDSGSRARVVLVNPAKGGKGVRVNVGRRVSITL